ncbi:leucine-rich repeat protein kinase family protein [Artemisia annua]|uniref:Leucine-rich repeat protein kinase family protein n=1 Tax=Artemisia annua TaxID=35608 RepID=A0A2U1KSX3_ARTAN|nr:leucine-rich repeat protein kinase family protein [Artemisia annua]
MDISDSNEKSRLQTDTITDCTSTITNENLHDEENEEVTSSVDSTIDISGKTFDLMVLDESSENNETQGLYVYKNVFNMIPRSAQGLCKLKTFKFFGNEVDLFPLGFGELVHLEKLQVKISSPGLSGLKLEKLKGLKELELSKAPPRQSALQLLKDIVVLERLTKLSVCHFDIRYLPPEIGCLSFLEYLDVSHNKMKHLPKEIANLSSLVTLKAANNKLVEVHSALSSLQRLEMLDLSNNRLKSLVNLELDKMQTLRTLNLKYNKLGSFLQVPEWISCDLEGNDEEMTNGESFSSSVEASVEIDVAESSTITYLHDDSSNDSIKSPSSYSERKPKKGLKPCKILSREARKQRLNLCESSNDVVLPEALLEDSSMDVVGDLDNKEPDVDDEVDYASSEQVDSNFESIESTNVEDDCVDNDEQSRTRSADGNIDIRKSKRIRGPTDRDSDISCKYSTISLCSINDRMPDGFYDAGRDRPFMSLDSYERILHFGSREVILMDEQMDEELDAITHCAIALVSHLNQMNGLNKDGENILLDELQIAFLLAQFVSDHFGGCDKSLMVERAKKSAFGSTYNKPFVCTCPTGINKNNMISAKKSFSFSEDAVIPSMCEKYLQLVKARRNSVVVPIGSLQYGVCRHRALLMKYLCDRVKPRVPCELVRGYLDFAPHAWNVVAVKRGDSEVRRINADATPDVDCPFPSLSRCEKIKEGGSTTLMKCNLGSVEAAAKVRTLKVNGSSADEARNFEYKSLGEVILLSMLKHPCIIKILGHQISTKWLPSEDGTPEDCILQSAIFMEHIKAGSLKDYIEKLARSGEKHVSVGLALQIAKDVAWALYELHSKDIIHRDLKSGNVLTDINKNADGATVVKLCDFDTAVPLRSSLHTCCIGHTGIPPPDACVGTVRWMAPEVYQTLHDRRESKIHELILLGIRPLLTDELEALGPVEDIEETESESEEYKKEKTMRFLIDIYRQCTKESPSDRPTAEKLYRTLVNFSILSGSQS